MQQILTLGTKIRLSEIDARQAWREFETLRARRPEEKLFSVGHFWDCQARCESEVWVQVDQVDGSEVATMYLPGEYY